MEDAQLGFAFEAERVSLPAGVWMSVGAVRDHVDALISDLFRVANDAPFRRMSTPGGRPMSVAMTNCGAFGWVSDHRGYRYERWDPQTSNPWPSMPESFRAVATKLADQAGFRCFEPDACLINRYAPGARMTLHQDLDEADLGQPIVSISLGLPATFVLGGDARRGATQRVGLRHGDAMVWGGPARRRYHGVLPLATGQHPVMGPFRYNLTFRRAAP